MCCAIAVQFVLAHLEIFFQRQHRVFAVLGRVLDEGGSHVMLELDHDRPLHGRARRDHARLPVDQVDDLVGVVDDVVAADRDVGVEPDDLVVQPLPEPGHD
jgi:hypothetical protein